MLEAAMQRSVVIIPAKTKESLQTAAKLKVAAYCRVSTDQEEQESSYEAQISYYTEKIVNNPDWTMVKIFADDGITGTQDKKRDQFIEMIRLCRKRKIDLILTKSISRFARNTVDTLKYVRELKAIGIGIIFEKENINTLEIETEMILTIMSCFAQAESESISKNVAWSLEDSDICIFLIDNGDGVPKGVQKEIDCAKKYKIKSLYYFCDETTKEKTPVENSLIGFQFVKTRTVNSFEELLEHSAQALIDDIVFIYRNYCKGRLTAADENNTEYEIGNDVYDESLLIEKSVLKNTDKCRKYFFSLFSDDRKNEENTSELDEWCVQFLPILFEHASIRNFNVAMLLEVLRKFQSEELNNVVEKRWKAIQSYFAGDIEDCIKHIEELSMVSVVITILQLLPI